MREGRISLVRFDPCVVYELGIRLLRTETDHVLSVFASYGAYIHTDRTTFENSVVTCIRRSVRTWTLPITKTYAFSFVAHRGGVPKTRGKW